MIRRIVHTLGIESAVNMSDSIRAAVLMNIAVLVRGYVLAIRRLRDAIERSHPPDIYAGLFEASNWLDSLSERDAGINSRADLQAVKFVRNRTHHQWASAVQLKDGVWQWRPPENLPLPDDPRHRNEKLEPGYQRHLADKPLIDVFDSLESYVTALAPDTDLT
jgi:hypothetical protein